MNYKTKNSILLFGFLVVLVASYKFAFSKTIALKNEYKVLKNKENLYSELPKKVAILNSKKKYYDSILNKYQLNNAISIQGNLLKTITVFAENNKLSVRHFKKPHSYTNNNTKVYTYNIGLQGEYNQLIQLVNKLENSGKYGEIISLNFVKKKNYRTKKYYLQLEFFVQNFIQ